MLVSFLLSDSKAAFKRLKVARDLFSWATSLLYDFWVEALIFLRALIRFLRAFWSTSVANSIKAWTSASSWEIWANDFLRLKAISLFSSSPSLTCSGTPLPDTDPINFLNSLMTASIALRTSACSLCDLLKSAASRALLLLLWSRTLWLWAFCFLYWTKFLAAWSLNFSYLDFSAKSLKISLLKASISLVSLAILAFSLAFSFFHQASSLAWSWFSLYNKSFNKVCTSSTFPFLF